MNMRIVYAFPFFALLVVVFVLYSIPTTTAQQELPPEVFIEDDNFDPSKPEPIRDESYTETQGSVEDSFHSIIYYDVYERAYKVEDFFPLGYSGVVSYEYHPRLYESEYGWGPVVSTETGSFKRGDKEIASYVKTFNTQGEQDSYSRKGFSVMIPIMQAIAAILGLNADPNDI